VAGARIALVQWWLEKRRPHTPENLAQAFHRLQRAAIRDAFGLRDGDLDGRDNHPPKRVWECTWTIRPLGGRPVRCYAICLMQNKAGQLFIVAGLHPRPK